MTPVSLSNAAQAQLSLLLEACALLLEIHKGAATLAFIGKSNELLLMSQLVVVMG